MFGVLSKRIVRGFSFVKKMSESLAASSERAKRLQDNVLEQNYSIENEAKLRKKVNFETSVEQLQQELNGEIARSLKKSEDKVKYFIQKTELMYKQLSNSLDKQKRQLEIQKYNQMVGLCQKARWQFMIHRQSVGFTLRNHELVHNLYKIPPRIIL